MFGLTLLLASLCACAHPPGPQETRQSGQDAATPPEQAAATAALKQLNDDWNRAWIEKDVAAVEKLMGSDYVYVAPNGQVLDRKAILAILHSPGYRIHHGTRTEVVIKPITADTGAVVHHWQGEGSFEGAEFHDNQRCTMMCARTGGQWQVVLEQCSIIAP
jgi:ketosteroid isomerase-like protein